MWPYKLLEVLKKNQVQQMDKQIWHYIQIIIAQLTAKKIYSMLT